MGPLFALLASSAATAPDLTICPDRPSKANGTCTVPVGHWQLEVSGPDWTRMLHSGGRADTTSIGQTFVKLGLSDHSDVEVGFTPFVGIRSSSDGMHNHVSGIGDVVVRYKHRLSGPDQQPRSGCCRSSSCRLRAVTSAMAGSRAGSRFRRASPCPLE